jgi:hypothetical protein
VNTDVLEYRVRSARRAHDLGYHFEVARMSWDPSLGQAGRKTFDLNGRTGWQRLPQRPWQEIESDLRSGRFNALLGHASTSRPDLGGLTWHDGDNEIATAEVRAAVECGYVGTVDLDRIAAALGTAPFGRSGRGGQHWVSRGVVVCSDGLKTKDTLALPGSEYAGPDGTSLTYVGELPDPATLPSVPAEVLTRYSARSGAAPGQVQTSDFDQLRAPMTVTDARQLWGRWCAEAVAEIGPLARAGWGGRAHAANQKHTARAAMLSEVLDPHETVRQWWGHAGAGAPDDETIALTESAMTKYPAIRMMPDFVAPASGTGGTQDPPEGGTPQVNPVFEDLVGVELGKLMVREEARKRLAERNAPPPSPIGELAVSLTDLLAEEDTEPDFRIAGLWPSGGNVLLSAQRKAGKSTLVGNVVRCLVDGAPLFSDDAPWLPGAVTPTHEVTPLPAGGKVVVFDTELTRKMVRGWLRDQGIRKTDDVVVVPLKGRLDQFRITDERGRRRWAEWLRSIGASVLIVDVAAPLLGDVSLDESANPDVQTWLAAFDALKAESGVTEGLVAHHTGHYQERARGASRWLDWPDAIWTVVYGTNPNEEPKPDAKRFFRAQGRDVAVTESELAFAPQTRRLFFSGAGSRSEQRADLTDAKARVLAYVSAHPGATSTELKNEPGGKGEDNASAARVLAGGGQLSVVEGLRQGQYPTKHHFIPGDDKADQMRALMAGDKVTKADISAVLNLVGPGGTQVGPGPTGELVGPAPFRGSHLTTTPHEGALIDGSHLAGSDTSAFFGSA